MADALGKDGLEPWTKRRVGVACGEEGLADVGDRCCWVTEDGRPLLDLFIEVLWEERGVASDSINKLWVARGGLTACTYAVPCQTCILG